MKTGNPLKHFLLAFMIALAIYATAYYAIENRRTRNGSWRVTFANDASGNAKLVIDQSKLGITNIQLSFSSPGNAHLTQAQTIEFTKPRAVPFNVPFGECIFMDTTFLPGTVTLRVLGHEIELLPRTLIIDRREVAWSPNNEIKLANSTLKSAAPEDSSLVKTNKALN